MRDSKLVIHESELLFKVIAERSERTSAMITTDLEFSKWPEMFKDATLVVALVDRLTYHSHILKMSKSLFDRRNSQILLSFSRLFQVGKLS